MSDTILFVFHADRGHFNFCLPLAAELSERGLACELWTNVECQAWTPKGYFKQVRTEFGSSNLQALTAGYKNLASSGENEAEGQAALYDNNAAGMIAMATSLPPLVPESEGEAFGPFLPVSKKGAEAFKCRLSDPDVLGVVFEGVWGKWCRDLVLEAGKKAFGLMPTYRNPFRAAYCSEPLWQMDGQCVVRSRPEDIDEFPGIPADQVSYVIADCLVGKATDRVGRRRFGAFLPSHAELLMKDTELSAWLDGDELPVLERTVTVVALGSQSALSTLSSTAEKDLLHGCLQASPRVLVASATISKALLDDSVLSEAVRSGKLRAADYLPQWATLHHENVRCFLSHGGANSAHEALASGTPVVPLPFFDDQFYVAARLEELYEFKSSPGWTPLRKGVLRKGGAEAVKIVSQAVQTGLSVPEATLSSLQVQVQKEDGAAAASEALLLFLRGA